MAQYRRLTLKNLLTMAGLPEAVVNASAGPIEKAHTRLGGAKWEVVTPVTPGAAKSKLQRSIEAYVDDDRKRKSFITMLEQLFLAISREDYQKVLEDGNVACKAAGSFKHGSHNHSLWELKFQNKDRIYFMPVTHEKRRYIVLFMAYHKKDRNTPPEVTAPCFKAMKEVLESGNKLDLM